MDFPPPALRFGGVLTLELGPLGWRLRGGNLVGWTKKDALGLVLNPLVPRKEGRR